MLPMEGYTVVALEQAVAAPLCTSRLADAGARVIKIERPEGDFARGYDDAAQGDSSYFVWTNQGKESVVLDIKDSADRAILQSMLAQADVFVQNLAPGATERLGLGSESLRRRYPRLITCDISGYGEDPAVAHLKAYDFLIQAESGLVAISGGENELGRVGVSVCDIGAGMAAYAAITEALLLRERSGEGASLKVSLFDVAAEWMTVPLVHHDYGAGAPTRQGLRHPSIAPYGAYPTSDGALTILSIQNEREWVAFCAEVLRRPDIATDPRYDSNTARVAHRDAMDAEIHAVTTGIDAATFRERLAAARIAFGAVNGVPELSHHLALRRRCVTTSQGDTLTIPAAPAIWADHPRAPLPPAPAIGRDTAAIRAEFGESDD
ncbi:CaiB/BaiF CoA-transferase family protein [Actibacterium sp. MT2.3-13A]|uniref:CaiB/BaiF CoA transferase family protein n=1 Tax=Actibacterium sp. MT2.3-13A TaxID=2828332 RepID=UPI001BA5286B|nr:CaiB/BaiF CoA-transferase family protein [Actibacterium sp. MT2.3-13A]